jgi:hypothetical protein
LNFANFRCDEAMTLVILTRSVHPPKKTSMKILMDEILQEIVEQAYGAARLGRDGDFEDRELIFAKVLSDLEVAGDAMRYVNSRGRIAWKATPWLRDHLLDLQRDAEAEFEAEDV